MSKHLIHRRVIQRIAQIGFALATVALLPPAHADTPSVLSGGYDYMCALTKTEGGLKCWGGGTLGSDSPSRFSTLPRDVAGVADVVTLATGNTHACALRSDGTVLCWSSNGWKGLANPAALTPQLVTNLGGAVIDLASGPSSNHVCATTSGSQAKCWGNNFRGQLGNGLFADTSVPQDVVGLGAISAIATGSDFSCAITVVGALKCWGYNVSGQLGNGSRTASASPVAVTGLGSGVIDVALGGAHSCAVLASGAVKCWGDDSKGQLGTGRAAVFDSGAYSTTPVDVVGVSGAVKVALGDQFSCALLRDGSVRCWGDRTTIGNGVSANGNSTPQPTPAAVIGLTAPAVTLATGSQYACVATTSGSVECWGVSGSRNVSYDEAARATNVNLDGLKIDTRLIMAEYRHASLDYFFLTSRYLEKLLFKAVVPAFQPTGKSFNVSPTGLQAGSAAISRFYFDQVAKGNSRGSHFYTLVESERTALAGLNPTNAATPRVPYNEGVDSFAFAPAVEGVGGSCAAGLTPLYRAFRGSKFPDDPNHRFTTDLALYSALVTSGWDGEGVKMCVSP